ncbi:hypothetical protein AK812_SmicGene14886 [Symbiodinium microadriaticum]|uniref:Uncharacterized protein n=1 Tax=Symbiodinium microadriaticum TaxID=2951 RepID=A0A1Q9E4G8_SYMMI|nr:hypothetical protein AK812_SmicGene14886 [Symbiodinium microadriaticum]
MVNNVTIIIAAVRIMIASTIISIMISIIILLLLIVIAIVIILMAILVPILVVVVVAIVIFTIITTVISSIIIRQVEPQEQLKYANKDNEEFVQLCEGGKMEQYAKRACTGSGGQDIVSGVSRDSYYCGSRSSGIDWGYLPVKEMCSAESGSGLSKKQLVMNVFESVSKWKDDPRLINVPSVGCIMGVVNCDIYFCQHCERVGCTAHNKSSVL